MSNALQLFDILTPFMLEGASVRGRLVRLGPVADTILGRYDYPPHARRLLGELLLAGAMLSANLKQQGIFTIQVRGNGHIPLIVVDAVFGGVIRGYADVRESSREWIREMKEYSPRALLGDGAYIAITYDPGEGQQRYQGIVALEGDSIADALMAYFTNSEQLDVRVKLTTTKEEPWRAGGIMIERMPSAPNDTKAIESWAYAQAVTATVTNEELIDPLLDAPELLYRLFHEEGVWVYDPHPLEVGCRCSRERITNILLGMKLEDRAHMVVDGKIDVHCQFCNKSEIFTPAEIGLSEGN